MTDVGCNRVARFDAPDDESIDKKTCEAIVSDIERVQYIRISLATRLRQTWSLMCGKNGD